MEAVGKTEEIAAEGNNTLAEIDELIRRGQEEVLELVNLRYWYVTGQIDEETAQNQLSPYRQ